MEAKKSRKFSLEPVSRAFQKLRDVSQRCPEKKFHPQKAPFRIDCNTEAAVLREAKAGKQKPPWTHQ